MRKNKHVWKSTGLKYSPSGPYQEVMCEGCDAKKSVFPEEDEVIREYYFNTISTENCDTKIEKRK